MPCGRSVFPFGAHVAEMDRKREKSLAYVTNLTGEERDNTLQRIAGNRNIVRWVRNRCRTRRVVRIASSGW